MIAHRASDRERQPSEEIKDFATDLKNVEYDPLHALLFTLTVEVKTGEPGVMAGPSELRVYDVTGSAPSLLSQIDLGQTAGGPATFLRAIPEDQKLLVIRPLGVSVFDYSNPTALVEGVEVVLGDGMTGLTLGTCASDSRRMGGLGLCVVQRSEDLVGDPIRRAFFVCGIDYAAGLPANVAKGGAGIVALDFTETYDAGVFSSFVFDPLADVCPLPTNPASPGFHLPRDYATRDLALYEDPATSKWYLAAVGATEHQLKIFAVTGFSTYGFTHYAEKDDWGGIQDELVAVDYVGSNLVILGRHYRFDVEHHNLTNFQVQPELFGDGPRGDTLLMQEGLVSAPATSLWSVPELSTSTHDLHLHDRWVFVGAELGFFVAELVDDGGTQKLELRSHVITDNGLAHPNGAVEGHNFLQARGIALVSGTNDRVFVSLNDDPEVRNNRFAFAAYDFDPATGTLGTTPLEALFDGAVATMPDDFPDLFLKGGGRLQAFTHENETQLFVGTQNGHVLQLSYFDNGGNEQLTTFAGRHWHNGAYFSEITECAVVDLASPGDPPDLRVCASKWRETFAVLVPFGFF